MFEYAQTFNRNLGTVYQIMQKKQRRKIAKVETFLALYWPAHILTLFEIKV